MSIDINSFIEIPFPGAAPIATPIKNCLQLASNYSPSVVSLSIDWSSLVAPSFNSTAIRIPLNINNGVRTPLDRIVSLYVNNSNNEFPIFIIFPDTQYGISVAPNAVQWFPVVTNGFNVIFASDFISMSVGKTQFIFSNVPISAIETSELQEVSPEWLGTNPGSSLGGGLILGNYRRAPSLGDISKSNIYSVSSIINNFLDNPDVSDASIITYIKEIWIDCFSLSLIKPSSVSALLINSITSRPIARCQLIIDNYQYENMMHLNNLDIRFNGGLDILLGMPQGVKIGINIIFTIRRE